MVKDSNTAASDMNRDLDLIGQWAHTWRMPFNPDPQKQAVELKFSKKKIEIDHPVVLFNNIPVKKVDEHRHLGIILDSKLSFSAHIKSAISKTRKGIGLLKYLSKYLPRHTLIEIFKLYARPHLDYGDVIYHIPAKVCEFSGNIVLQSNGKARVCSVFCCFGCNRNMEGYISREAVHRPWSGVFKFLKMLHTSCLVKQVCK